MYLSWNTFHHHRDVLCNVGLLRNHGRSATVGSQDIGGASSLAGRSFSIKFGSDAYSGPLATLIKAGNKAM